MALLIPTRRGNNCGRSGLSAAPIAAFFLLFLSVLNLAAQPAATKEYQLKAVFLFNFSQFVEWPTNAFTDSQSPITIGVLGTDPFGSSLDDTVRGEKVNGRPLVVQRYGRVEDIKDCHIIFISQSEEGRLEQILENLKGRSILTVADTDQAARRGVMIRFVMENNKIRLRINLASARTAGLTISSKLLRPATIVVGDKN